MSSERRIRKLDAVTVARIAAGEVVNRPANALKEIIENSIDAGSTSIQVTLRDGGLSLLQVTDDGSGITQPDLELLCERHATSKLSDAIDLPSVSTLGFRGEALASVCAIAKRVTVVTRTADSRCAFRAEYSETGKLTNCVQQAAAQRSGTCISVEQLFERAPSRSRMFETTGSGGKRVYDTEFSHCFEIVLRFALHFPKIGFVLRKSSDSNSKGKSTADEIVLQTNANANSTVRDVAARLFGSQFAAQLTDFVESSDAQNNNGCEFSFSSIMTSPNAKEASTSSPNANRMVSAVLRRPFFSFSINNRLVESFSGLRNVFRSAFAECASRLSVRPGSSMFVVGSLQISDRTLVDANIHPAKAEVRIAMHEQAILVAIDASLRNCIGCAPICDMPSLQAAAAATNTATPPVAVAVASSSNARPTDSDDRERSERKRDAPNFLVRTDCKSRKIDEYLSVSKVTSKVEDSANWQQATTPLVDQAPFDTIGSAATVVTKVVRPRSREVRLRRVVELRDEAKTGSNLELTSLLRDAVFVGVCDAERCVLQSGVRLYLVNLRRLSREFFFQNSLTHFGNFPTLQFEEPIRVDDLLQLAFDFDMATLGVDVDADAEETRDRRAAFVRRGVSVLRRHAEMLFDYFSVLFTDKSGQVPRRGAEDEDQELLLAGLPSPIDDSRFTPETNRLPTFVKQLVQNVVWTEEKQCYRTICSALSELFCCKAPFVKSSEQTEADDEAAANVVEHGLFSAMKQALIDGQFFLPISFQSDRVFVELASLPNLYRVFERC